MNSACVQSILAACLLLCANQIAYAGTNETTTTTPSYASANLTGAKTTLKAMDPSYFVTGAKAKMWATQATPDTTPAALNVSKLLLIHTLLVAGDSDFRLTINTDRNDAHSIGFLPLAKVVHFNPRQHALISALNPTQAAAKKSSSVAYKTTQQQQKRVRTDRSRYGSSRSNNHRTK